MTPLILKAAPTRRRLHFQAPISIGRPVVNERCVCVCVCVDIACARSVVHVRVGGGISFNCVVCGWREFESTALSRLRSAWDHGEPSPVSVRLKLHAKRALCSHIVHIVRYVPHKAVHGGACSTDRQSCTAACDGVRIAKFGEISQGRGGSAKRGHTDRKEDLQPSRDLGCEARVALVADLI